MANPIKIGDTVDFACLHGGVYGLYPAVVTEVFPDDGAGPQALAMIVDFPQQLLDEGIAAVQDYHREADPTLEQPESGTWRRR